MGFNLQDEYERARIECFREGKGKSFSVVIYKGDEIIKDTQFVAKDMGHLLLEIYAMYKLDKMGVTKIDCIELL